MQITIHLIDKSELRSVELFVNHLLLCYLLILKHMHILYILSCPDCKTNSNLVKFMYSSFYVLPRAIKRVGGPQIGPFNWKNFRVRVLIFSASLNQDFFSLDRASPWLAG